MKLLQETCQLQTVTLLVVGVVGSIALLGKSSIKKKKTVTLSILYAGVGLGGILPYTFDILFN